MKVAIGGRSLTSVLADTRPLDANDRAEGLRLLEDPQPAQEPMPEPVFYKSRRPVPTA